MSGAYGLTDSEIYWLEEQTRLQKRVYELEVELRKTERDLQYASDRYRNPRAVRPPEDPLIAETWRQLDRGEGRGPRCVLCGWAVDELGGSTLLCGVCEMCRGIYGHAFAKPRALVEAVIEEPYQPILAELAAADAWSVALGQPVGMGQKVNAVAFLCAQRQATRSESSREIEK